MKPKNTLRSFLAALGASIIAVSSATADNGTWNQAAGGTYSWDTEGNWVSDTIATGTDNTATFGNISGAQTVNLDTARTIGNIDYTNANNFIMNIAGDILTLDVASGTPIINTDTIRTLQITSQIAGSDGLRKDGSGILILGGVNTYTGGTVINAGELRIGADSALGSAGAAITFNGNATLGITGSLVSNNRAITLNNGAIANFRQITAGGAFATSGAVTGTGGVQISSALASTRRTFAFNSFENTFTGPVRIGDSSRGLTLTMRSLADSDSTLTFGRNTANGEDIQFNYQTDPDNPVALTLDNRQIVLDGGGAGAATLINASGLPMTINKDLGWTSTTGNRTFQLTGGGGGGTFNGDLDNHPDSGLLAMTFANSWTLTGNNTYSGMTNILAGATVEFQGTAAMPASASLIQLSKSSTIRILTDQAGTVNLGNNIQLDRTDTSTGIMQNYTIHVGNNGGATTGSAIVLGNVDFTKNDMRPPRQITTTAANSYSVEIGDVMLTWNIQGTTAGGAQRFTPSTASLEITGTVKHINGDNGSRANAHSLYLGGAMTGNLISGTIADADDFTNESNEFARPLSIYKDGAGDWTFSGTNTYTGTTTINAGTLLVNGDQSAATGAVSVNGTSTLGGSGILGGNVTVAAGANLAPGESVGTLTILGDLDISAMAGGAGQLFYELGPSNASDQIAVTGTLDIGTGALGLTDFDFTNVGGLEEGVYILITSGGITGTLDGDSLHGDIDGTDITLGTSSGNIILTVGEPSGTPYELWAGPGVLFDEDSNGDGVSNGMAFLLGASGPNVSALGLLPTVTESGGGLVMTFSMLNSANRGTAVLKLEHSNSLATGSWTTVTVPDTSSTVDDVVFTVTGTGPLNVTATIPVSKAAAGKLFGRLKATE